MLICFRCENAAVDLMSLVDNYFTVIGFHDLVIFMLISDVLVFTYRLEFGSMLEVGMRQMLTMALLVSLSVLLSK